MNRLTLALLGFMALCLAPIVLRVFGLLHAAWWLVFLPLITVLLVVIGLTAIGCWLVGREYRSADKDSE